MVKIQELQFVTIGNLESFSSNIAIIAVPTGIVTATIIDETKAKPKDGRCPRCGERVRKSDRYCSHCGEKL